MSSDAKTQALLWFRQSNSGNENTGFEPATEYCIIIQKIINSEEFKKHSAESNLLKYLAEVSLKEEIPDQTSIAVHALGKTESFDPNEDSIVRVRVHNLRKMLNAYYLAEGAHDRTKLMLSPGSYQLKFVPSKTLKHDFHFWYYLMSVALMMLLLLANVYQWRSNQTTARFSSLSQDTKASLLWSDFLDNNLPVLLALGNNYFFHEIPYDTTQPYRTVRYSSINSHEDLNRHFQTRNQSKYYIKEHDVGLYENEIILSIHHILPMLHYHNKHVDIKPSSDLKPQDLLKYNILYLGNTKNLRLLESLLKNLNINFDAYNYHYRFIVKTRTPDTARVHTSIGADTFGRRLDYVIFDKLPGPNANQILIITCTDLTGVHEMVKLITDPDRMPYVQRTISGTNALMPKYFESLWQVSSLNRTGFTIKPVQSFSIPSDIELIMPNN